MKELLEYPVEQGINLIPMFSDHKYLSVIINSSIQEKMGTLLIDNLEDPTVCLLSYFSFVALAGDINSPAIDLLLESVPFHKILLIPDDSWYQVLKGKYGMRLVTSHSKRRKFSSEALNIDFIRSLKKPLPKHLKLEAINETNADLFDMQFSDSWI